jgi:hypothetical protein
MHPFVRFIFTLLVVGIITNLVIVMFSNANTHREQIRDLATERQRFDDHVKVINRQMRRGEITVEWQRLDANQKVLESSLLIRQFMPREEGPIALPTIRVIIPGDRVCIDGLKLYFDNLFSEEYEKLRDVTLFNFGKVYADGAPAETRFNFLTPYTVPVATQIHTADNNPRATYFENKLWQYVWSLIDSKEPEKRGLTVKWMDPACKVVRTGALYQISIGLEGITISEDESWSQRPHRDEMLREAEKLK